MTSGVLEETAYIKDFCKTNGIKTIRNCTLGWTQFIEHTNDVENVGRISNFARPGSIKVPYDAFLLYKKQNKRLWYDVEELNVDYFKFIIDI